ncbi:IS3 family transposase [Gemmatimonadota bacterium]
MPRRRYTENQIFSIIQQYEAGVPVKQLCREHGMAEQTFYRWKAKYTGLDKDGVREVKRLQEENTRLKKIVTQQALDNQALKEVLGKGLLTRSQKRLAVSVMTGLGLSERRACWLLDFPRSTQRYRSQRTEEPEIRQRLRELAFRWRRFGYRRLTVMLHREGYKVNHKRVYRLYREEGLQVRRKRRKRITRSRRQPLPEPTAPNHRWSMDFMADQMYTGRRFRVLNIVDDFTRECLAIEVDTSLPGARVVRVLDRLIKERGKPDVIVTDNGPEFTGKALDAWAYQNDVKLDFIDPGKPNQNAFIESFNSKIRDECLNEHWFESLQEARTRIEFWRYEYNHLRPHSSLNNLTPMEYVAIIREEDQLGSALKLTG